VFGDHVELEDVIARFVRRAKAEFHVGRFSRGQVARKRRPAAVPIYFLFISAQQMRAEPRLE
jgi:hypothetical protein